jgi:very-short-patch-repair endonuclease
MADSSDLEETLAWQMKVSKFPVPEREHRFAPPRRWRFDFAWPALMVAVEAEGGTWAGGRHTTGTGFRADCQKYNAAVELGWRVLRFTGTEIEDGSALLQLGRVLTMVTS